MPFKIKNATLGGNKMKKRFVAMLTAVMLLISCFGFCTYAEGETLSIASDSASYKTNSILTPTISGVDMSGGVTLKWEMADAPDAPDSAWQTVAEKAVTAANYQTNGRLFVTQAQTDKYIRLRCGDAVSAPTPIIQYEHNLAYSPEIPAFYSQKITGVITKSDGGILVGTGDGTQTIMGLVDTQLQTENFLYGKTYNAGIDLKAYKADGADTATKKVKIRVASGGYVSTGHGWVSSDAEISTEGWRHFETKALTMNQKNERGAPFFNLTALDGTAASIKEIGSVYVRNIHFSNSAPFAKDVSIVGNGAPGTMATGNYTIDHTYNGDASGDASTYRWFISDDAKVWSVIDDATSKSIEVKSEWLGKYLRFEVTPKGTTGDAGVPRVSTETFECKLAEAAAGAARLECGNTDTASVFIPSYTYAGTKTEKDSKLEWLVSSDNVTWTTLKTVENITAATVTESAYLLADSTMAGKYIKFRVTPKAENGAEGDTVESAVKGAITYSAELVNNGDFSLDTAYGWTGGTLASGALNVDTAASFAGKSPIEGGYKIQLSLDVKAQSAENAANVTVKIDDDTVTTIDAGADYATKTVTKSISARSTWTLKLETDKAVTIDNVSMKLLKPTVTALNVTGTPTVGQTLTAAFEVSGVDEVLSTSEYMWEVSDNGTSGWKTHKLTKSMTLSQSDEGKYFRFKVTPKDEDGISGDTMYSTVYKCTVAAISAASGYITSNTENYKTNSYLTPHYTWTGTVSEGESTLEWQMSDFADAPDEYWETMSMTSWQQDNSSADRTSVSETKYIYSVTADTAGSKGSIQLEYGCTNKYIRFKLTPKNSSGKAGEPMYSEVTPLIEYTPNIARDDMTKDASLWYKASGKVSEAKVISDSEKGDVLFVNAENAPAGEYAWSSSGNYTIIGSLKNMLDYDTTYTMSFNMKLDAGACSTKTGMRAYANYVTSSASIATGMSDDVFDSRWTAVKSTGLQINSTHPLKGLTAVTFNFQKQDTIKNSGKFMLDSVFLAAERPWATDVEISEGETTLTGKYTFCGLESTDSEMGTQYAWYQSDTAYGPWTAIPKETSKTLARSRDFAGKYVRFGVTPADSNAHSGLEILSSNVVYIESEDTIDIDSDKTVESGDILTRSVSFTNNTNAPRKITAVLTLTKTVGGVEKQLDSVVQTKTVAGHGTETFTLSTRVTDDTASCAQNVFVCEGEYSALKYLSGKAKSADGENLRVSRAEMFFDTAEARLCGNTGEKSQSMIALLMKPGYSATDIESRNTKNIIEFFGAAKSGANGGYEYSFGFAPTEPESGKTTDYTLYRSIGGEGSSFTISYYGSEINAAAVNALKGADNAGLEGIFAESTTNLAGGKPMYEVLNIDMTDFRKLENAASVYDAVISSGRANLKTMTKAFYKATEARLIAEEDMRFDKFVTDFVNGTDKTDAQIEAFLKNQGYTPRYAVWREYSLDVDTTSEYGYALSLDNATRQAFVGNIVAAIKGGTTAEYVEEKFAESVTLNAVNLVSWSKMQEVLKAHESAIGVDVDAKYGSLSPENVRKLNADVANQTFATIGDIKTCLTNWKPTETDGNNGDDGGLGGGGGGLGGGSTGGGMTIGGDLSQIGGSVAPSIVSGFSDLPASHWAYSYMKKLTDLKLLGGYGDGTVKPDAEMTRAEFAKLLVCALGILNEGAECDFADVSKDDWSYKYVATAFEKGIIFGVDAESFGKDSPITREQMAAMICRAAQYAKIALEGDEKTEFADFGMISEYAAEAVEALAACGILCGTDGGNFDPHGEATRAAVSKVIVKLLEITEENR